MSRDPNPDWLRDGDWRRKKDAKNFVKYNHLIVFWGRLPVSFYEKKRRFQKLTRKSDTSPSPLALNSIRYNLQEERTSPQWSRSRR